MSSGNPMPPGPGKPASTQLPANLGQPDSVEKPSAPRKPKFVNHGSGPRTSAPGEQPAQASARPEERHFGGKKRKAPGSNAAGTSISKTETRALKAIQQLTTWTNDATSEPRGQDYPSGQHINKSTKEKPVRILMSSTLPDRGIDPVATLHEGFQVALRLDSQTPCFLLTRGKWEIRVHGDVMRLDTATEEGDRVFTSTDIDQNKWAIREIKKALEEEHKHDTVVDAVLESLKKFGEIEQTPEKSGLQILTFHMKPSKKIAAKWTDNKSEPVVDEMLNLFVTNINKSKPTITLVRKLQIVHQDVEAYLRHRLRVCADKGLYPFYSEETDAVVGGQFTRWQSNPSLKLAHQHWMQLPNMKPNASLRKFASHAAKFQFMNMEEWKLIMSVALIQEIDYENECNNKYFGWGVKHKATAVRRSGGYVELEILSPKIEDLTPPIISAGSRLDLRLTTPPTTAQKETPATVLTKANEGGKKSPKQASAETADEQHDLFQDDINAPDFGEDDEEMGDDDGDEDEEEVQEIAMHGTDANGSTAAPTPVDIRRQNIADAKTNVRKCRALDKETSKTLVVSMFIGPKDAGAKVVFELGKELDVELKLKRNEIPSKRMMRAVAHLAALKEDTSYAQYLRHFLLGEKFHFSGTRIPISSMKDIVKKSFDVFFKDLNLNAPQLEAWNSVIASPEPINIIQGPPGTGKTKLDVALGMSFALSGWKTAICAPTNKACEAMMDSLIESMEKFYKLIPKARQIMKVLYVPTSKTLMDQLEDVDLVLEAQQEARQGEEVTKYHQYELWYQIENHFRALVASTTALKDARENAQEWLQTLGDLRAGKDLNHKFIRAFMDANMSAAQRIMQDQSTKIVVCTSNNSALVKDYGFQPLALILDECAFDTEPGSCVPLALNAKKIALTGDHEQLKPGAKRPNTSEYCEQYGISIFERVLKAGGVPLFRLKINYRMHPDIALLPGVLSYGWLRCADSTKLETELYQYVESFWNSKANEKHRNTRQRGQWSKEQHQKCRRVFFNVQNGSSGKPKGTTSFINFANIYAIVDKVAALLGHNTTVAGMQPMDPSAITIITGYAEERKVLDVVLKMVLRSLGYDEFPMVTTIDSSQGGQNEIVILSMTAASTHHGYQIGFLKVWNRMNVALTRAKQCLWIFGNLDLWRKNLKVIYENLGAKKFAMFLIDVIDRGDVVNITADHATSLPAATDNLMDMSTWSLKAPESSKETRAVIVKRDAVAANYQHLKPLEREGFEKKILAKLNALRNERNKMEEQFKNGLSPDTNLFHVIEGEGQETDAVNNSANNDNSDNQML